MGKDETSIVYDSMKMGDRVVENIPYTALPWPCSEGCCEHELCLDGRRALQVAWLLETYMVDEGLKAFDFQEWSVELEGRWLIEIDHHKTGQNST